LEEKLKKYLYEGVSSSSDTIAETIKCFSAYLDQYDNDYKYNYKFLISHINDFEKALKANKLFKEQCEKVIAEILTDKLLKEQFDRIQKSRGEISCTIDFNNTLAYSIDNTKSESESSWKVKRSVKKQYWDDLVEYKSLKLNICVELQYKDINLFKRYYSVDTTNRKYLKNICSFFDNAYEEILKSSIKPEILNRLIELKFYLPKEHDLIVLINNKFLLYPLRFSDYCNLFYNKVMVLDEDLALAYGKTRIINDKFKYIFDSDNISEFESELSLATEEIKKRPVVIKNEYCTA